MVSSLQNRLQNFFWDAEVRNVVVYSFNDCSDRQWSAIFTNLAYYRAIITSFPAISALRGVPVNTYS